MGQQLGQRPADEERQREILNAFSAADLRRLPATRVQVTVTAQTGSGEPTIADYTLEHAGAFDRRAGER